MTYMFRIPFPEKTRTFYAPNVQIDTGSQTPNSRVHGKILLVKRPEREAQHFHPFGNEICSAVDH